jgi:hypothetical protein
MKLNCVIAKDYSEKLKSATVEYGFMGKLENIDITDEKERRLCLHHIKGVYSDRGVSHRLHFTAPEHGENVSTVAYGKALG